MRSIFFAGLIKGRHCLFSITIFKLRKVRTRTNIIGTILMLIVKEAFPKLTIAPESFGLKIAEAFGVANDIKFESAEFSRKFSVRSADKKFAYDVCNQQMMEYLLLNPDLTNRNPRPGDFAGVRAAVARRAGRTQSATID